MKKETINPNQLNLFEPFLSSEIDFENDYVTYIYTSSNNSNIVHNSAVTSNSCKTTKTLTDNIKNSLKTAKNNHSKLIILGKGMKKLNIELRLSEQCGKKNEDLRTQMREIHNLRRDISGSKHFRNHTRACSA